MQVQASQPVPAEGRPFSTACSPVTCLATLTTRTGRPKLSLWSCMYTLPVAASAFTMSQAISSALHDAQGSQAPDC